MLAVSPFSGKVRGFTLIELLVVLALLAIIASLAAPSFQRTIARQKLSLAASDLMASAMQARSEAIKNNQQAVVQPVVDTDWGQGWRIYVDVDKDKVYTEGTDTLVTTVPAVADGVLVYEVALNSAVGNLVAFDASGFLVGRNAGRIVFSSNSLPSSELRKGIKVSVTGRTRICSSVPGNDGCASSD
ncbi:GspH/FimT family protein [Polaromonas sp.]|uniref:GspH/FimT family pseudopilin n=1 Tax=Polaromonas sp. TaxID=1869339 RepID=UPI00248A175E|nr:GspH/FimT family protein [Polaromonas sp.]MDI1275788.1 GspH/FimT family protein [Polaromonas sp.]